MNEETEHAWRACRREEKQRAESDGEAFSEQCLCYYITYLPLRNSSQHRDWTAMGAADFDSAQPTEALSCRRYVSFRVRTQRTACLHGEVDESIDSNEAC